jgi:hypothetical protein
MINHQLLFQSRLGKQRAVQEKASQISQLGRRLRRRFHRRGILLQSESGTYIMWKEVHMLLVVEDERNTRPGRPN